MIVRLKGKLIEKRDNFLVVQVNGLEYEVMVPLSVSQRIESICDPEGNVSLITYHYLQMEPSRGLPALVGFINEIEKDFFEQFIKVSGIGPRAAVKALNKPISEITRAIEDNDLDFLKSLPGIGIQRAKDIVAKLQGKVGRFGLIQDKGSIKVSLKQIPDWQGEALDVLLQLQYKKQEAVDMIQKAMERSQDIQTAEGLLNEIYKQRIQR